MRMIKTHVTDRVIPRPSLGFYPCEETLHKLFTHYRESGRRGGGTEYKAKLESKLDEQVRELRLRNEESERQLVPVNVVERVWGEIIDVFRQQITALQIPEAQKLELIANLQKPKTDEYFSAANIVAQDLGGSDTGPADGSEES